MDREAWYATVHGVTKSQTEQLSMHAPMYSVRTLTMTYFHLALPGLRGIGITYFICTNYIAIIFDSQFFFKEY